MILLSGSWKRSYVEKASIVIALARTTWWWILPGKDCVEAITRGFGAITEVYGRTIYILSCCSAAHDGGDGEGRKLTLCPHV